MKVKRKNQNSKLFKLQGLFIVVKTKKRGRMRPIIFKKTEENQRIQTLGGLKNINAQSVHGIRVHAPLEHKQNKVRIVYGAVNCGM